MSETGTFILNGVVYKNVRTQFFLCRGCGRRTITGLCGCGNQDSRSDGYGVIGFPLNPAEESA